jgi:hypothetical protein
VGCIAISRPEHAGKVAILLAPHRSITCLNWGLAGVGLVGEGCEGIRIGTLVDWQGGRTMVAQIGEIISWY